MTVPFIDVFNSYIKMPAPVIAMSVLPAVWASSADTSQLDFLIAIRIEAEDILKEGDSLISKEEMPFSSGDIQKFYAAILGLSAILEKRIPHANTEENLQNLLASMENIKNFYDLKIERSQKQRFEIQKKMAELTSQERVLIGTLGTKGIIEVYELDEKIELRNRDGTLNFAAKGQRMDDDAHEIAYSGINLALRGPSPGMQRLIQGVCLLDSDIKRNSKVQSALNDTISHVELCYDKLNWPKPVKKQSQQPTAKIIIFPGCEL